ncbi:unnamed protein product, partial [Anisakis simplex]|uniref:Uncharacterized protein n=1 Tax=Anisakis simplex TaxID=6269 RepID=A0A0M3JPR8_ANISI
MLLHRCFLVQEAAVSSEATCEQAARAGSVEGLGQQLEKMRGAGGAAGTGLEESTAATSSGGGGGGTTSVPTSTPTTTRVALRGGGTAHLSASGTLQLVIPGQQQQACAVAGGSTQISPASSLGSGSGHGLGSALSSARS